MSGKKRSENQMPEETAQVTAAWVRIDAWLAKHASAVRRTLRRGLATTAFRRIM